MPIKRTEHWLTRELNTFLTASKTTAFAWGTNDCCLFAANAIQAMTGVDIADDFRGKYTSEATAFALIKTITGGMTVADAAVYCAKKHNLSECKYPLLAQRGDLVVVNNAGRLIAGVVDLSGKYVAAMGDTGVVRISIMNIERAWHV